jgi:hypothetical protein
LIGMTCTHETCVFELHPDLRARVVAVNGVQVKASCGATLRLSALSPKQRKQALAEIPPPILDVLYTLEPSLKSK